MKHNLLPTKNDIPSQARTKLVDLLNSRLASGIDLYLQAKHAHWNVKGPQFIALHELFDQVATTVSAANDEIAERAAQLGGPAHGTVQIVGKESDLPPYPFAISTGPEHVDALSNALAAFGAQVRSAIDLATELRDADTADLFTGVSREIDKQLWFVEAHNQGA